MAIENDVKEILDKHDVKLEEHSHQLQKLNIETEVSKERLSNIESQLGDVKQIAMRTENTVLQSYNATLQALTTITTTRDNNKTAIWIKIIGGLFAVLGAFFAGSQLM